VIVRLEQAAEQIGTALDSITWTRDTDYGEWSRSKQSGGFSKE